MAYDAVAFCPGHITGFFEVCPDDDPYRMGSRGAGICISHGVYTAVLTADADFTSIDVSINGRTSDAPVTKRAIMNLPIPPGTHIQVQSEVQLPVSQGFGMSGAGALSAAIAVNKALGLGLAKDDVLRAAHRAEIECKSGLGDVFPQSVGGLVIRREPGAPPHGRIERHEVQMDVVLCIVGPPISTEDVLADKSSVGRIAKLGKEFTDGFADVSLDDLFRLSLEFSKRTGLISKDVLAAVEACGDVGMASMSMLGNSVFAAGETEKLRYRLLDFGETFVTSIENRGAREIASTREE